LRVVSSDEPLLTFSIFSARLPRRIPNVQSVRRACDGFAEFLNGCKALPSGFEHVVTAAFIVSSVNENDVPSKAWFAERKQEISDLAKCGIYIQVHTVDFGAALGSVLSDLNGLSLDPKRATMAMTTLPIDVPAVMNELGAVMITDTPTTIVVIRPPTSTKDAVSCCVPVHQVDSVGTTYSGQAAASQRASPDLLRTFRALCGESRVYLPVYDTIIENSTVTVEPIVAELESSFDLQATAFRDAIWTTVQACQAEAETLSGLLLVDLNTRLKVRFSPVCSFDCHHAARHGRVW
jgi:hypothetical protein